MKRKNTINRLARVATLLQKIAGYSIVITEKEMDSLGWLANRYSSAKALYDNLEVVDEAKGLYNLPEHAVWEACEAGVEDGAVEGVIPNLGGELAEKVQKLFDSMV